MLLGVSLFDDARQLKQMLVLVGTSGNLHC